MCAYFKPFSNYMQIEQVFSLQGLNDNKQACTLVAKAVKDVICIKSS